MTGFFASDSRSPLRERVFAAAGDFEFDRVGDLDIDNLSPEIARDVDLAGPDSAWPGDHAGQNLGDAGRVADFFLIGTMSSNSFICSTS